MTTIIGGAVGAALLIGCIAAVAAFFIGRFQGQRAALVNKRPPPESNAISDAGGSGYGIVSHTLPGAVNPMFSKSRSDSQPGAGAGQQRQGGKTAESRPATTKSTKNTAASDNKSNAKISFEVQGARGLSHAPELITTAIAAAISTGVVSTGVVSMAPPTQSDSFEFDDGDL